MMAPLMGSSLKQADGLVMLGTACADIVVRANVPPHAKFREDEMMFSWYIFLGDRQSGE